MAAVGGEDNGRERGRGKTGETETDEGTESDGSSFEGDASLKTQSRSPDVKNDRLRPILN